MLAGFGGIDNMMRDMMQMSNSMMRQMMTMPSDMASMHQGMMGGGGAGGGNGTAYFYSSSQSFNSADPSQNFVRTTTTTAGPGGVLETRTAVRDGRDGCEKLGLRRQLGDRVAQVERIRNLQTGEEQSRKTVHNLPEDDEEAFDREWMNAASRSLPHYATATQGSGGSPISYQQAPTAPLAIADRPAERTASYVRAEPVTAPAFPQYGGSAARTVQQPPSRVSASQYQQPVTRTAAAPQRIPVVTSERSPVRATAAAAQPGPAGTAARATSFMPTSPYASPAAQPAPATTTTATRQPRYHRDGSFW